MPSIIGDEPKLYLEDNADECFYRSDTSSYDPKKILNGCGGYYELGLSSAP